MIHKFANNKGVNNMPRIVSVELPDDVSNKVDALTDHINKQLMNGNRPPMTTSQVVADLVDDVVDVWLEAHHDVDEDACQVCAETIAFHNGG